MCAYILHLYYSLIQVFWISMIKKHTSLIESKQQTLSLLYASFVLQNLSNTNTN